MGEATSDYLVHQLHPVPAVLLGFICFRGCATVAVLAASLPRLGPIGLPFCMVGVFGTMAADVLHVGFGVPYFASATFYGSGWRRSS